METAEMQSGQTGTFDERIEREFSVESGAKFSVNNVSGRITIRAGEPGTIRVRAVKRGSDRARENTNVEFEVEGNRVAVRTRTINQAKHFGIHFGSSMASVEYDIVVPPDTRVEAKGVSSSIEVNGLRAPVTAKTVSGAISASDISGDLQFGSVSGSVRGSHLNGELSLHGTSGSAVLESSRFPNFNIHNVSGSFTIDTPLSSGGRYQAHTVSGSLKLLVPAGSGATIQLKSVSGGVLVDGLNSQSIKTGPRHWHGRIGDGGATVEMHSVSGSIRIESNGSEVRAGDATQTSTVSHERRTEILRALQQGEIDVEEAMTRLEGR